MSGHDEPPRRRPWYYSTDADAARAAEIQREVEQQQDQVKADRASRPPGARSGDIRRGLHDVAMGASKTLWWLVLLVILLAVMVPLLLR